jgi:hypothetical protein
VCRGVLRAIAEQFKQWLKGLGRKPGYTEWGAPNGPCDEFVDRYFKRAKPAQVVIVLTAREPARIMTGSATNRRTARLAPSVRGSMGRPVQLLHHRPGVGTMFVRICPFIPFSARVCLPQ